MVCGYQERLEFDGRLLCPNWSASERAVFGAALDLLFLEPNWKMFDDGTCLGPAIAAVLLLPGEFNDLIEETRGYCVLPCILVFDLI